MWQRRTLVWQLFSRRKMDTLMYHMWAVLGISSAEIVLVSDFGYPPNCMKRLCNLHLMNEIRLSLHLSHQYSVSIPRYCPYYLALCRLEEHLR